MKRLLVLSPSVPFPADDGVKLRLSNLLRRMPDDWTVDLLCFDRVEQLADAAATNGECERLTRVPLPASLRGWRARSLVQALRPEASLIWKFTSSEMAEQVRQRSRQADAVLAVGLQMAQYLGVVNPRAVTALDNYNVESRILARMADTRAGAKRLYWRWEAAKLLRAERRLLRAARTVFAISDVDCEELARLAPAATIRVLPMGIDFQHFEAAAAPETEQAIRFTFIGAFNWHVNEDAAQWLVRDVWPLVRAQVPKAELHLVGRAPSPAVLALGSDSSVQVSGTVPDVRPYMAASRALLVPLRYGSGVRTKILEAFAARRPVISTPVGCEGIPVEHGKHLLIASGTAAFAQACVRLALEPEAARELASNAHGWVASADQSVTEMTRRVLQEAFSSR